MIIVINYADKRFKKTQKLNSRTARKWGADMVISYNREDMDEEYIRKNEQILKGSIGGGFFVWKPYFIKKTYNQMQEGDYLFYIDSGAVCVDRIQHLINCMEKEQMDVMVFSLENERLEKQFTKRDTFLLMNCDSPKDTDTPQVLAGYMIFKKTDFASKFIDEWLYYAQDARISTTMENTLGLPNYEGFVANRTQSVPSLLAKKYGLKIFRDPSQFGVIHHYPKDIEERSSYPQIIDSHRMRKVRYLWQIPINRNKYVQMLKYKIYLWKKAREK